MARPLVNVNVESMKGQQLGSGCYGTVYALKDDDSRVLKIGQNDGTRTYLEWCYARQRAGRGLRGMPRIDALWTLEEPDPDAPAYSRARKGQYACVMERLPIDPGRPLGQEGWAKYFGRAVYCPATQEDSPKYLKRLLEAMREETGLSGNDMHYQNFMARKDGTIVMTDPDSGSFVEPYPTFRFDDVGPMRQQDLFV